MLSGNPPIIREAEGSIEDCTGEGTKVEEVEGGVAASDRIDEEGDQ